ncbi:hypothetical protein ZIOFF_033570 [Zingiber officinale]|uniref:Uncharacterized protein n=1 Tax=Zingiber officinale TaxID=94328 RepID=A0A8J5GX82_ZINOF|nr:hypothetical protein ZIOFF_033570 [Zingiber officinale]
MAQANNNGENSNPFISFSLPESSSLSSTPSPSIFKPENGDQHHQELEIDADIFLFDTPNVIFIISTPLFNETKQVEALKNESGKKEDMNRVLIDTAAPFESVRAAVTKFRGIAACKAEEIKSHRIQDEIVKFQKSFQVEETAAAHVLEELDYCKGLAEELHLRLERAQTLKEQAKQDTELAELRLREVEQGIANVASIASKAQLDVANERRNCC